MSTLVKCPILIKIARNATTIQNQTNNENGNDHNMCNDNGNETNEEDDNDNEAENEDKNEGETRAAELLFRAAQESANKSANKFRLRASGKKKKHSKGGGAGPMDVDGAGNGRRDKRQGSSSKR